MSVEASQSNHIFAAPSYDGVDRKRTAIIYQPQCRATQNTPRMNWGEGWAIKFEQMHQYKSPLMHWASGSEDAFAPYEIKSRNLQEAINFCKEHGFGYDVLMPRFRYHTRKGYIDNFKWKGKPKKPEVDDD